MTPADLRMIREYVRATLPLLDVLAEQEPFRRTAHLAERGREIVRALETIQTRERQ